ncbi:nuclease-related domain-containing protein, partial [Planctomycetota bacterium]
MLYPQIDIESISNIGERLVAEALSSYCPKEWVIIYSKYWLWKYLKYNCHHFKEGEIDFVVVVPNKGFVVLEVKSAKNYRLTDRGIWQRFDTSSAKWIDYSKSPWEQASSNKHALVSILAERCSCKRLGCGYGAAVVFPRCRMEGKLPAGEDDSAMIINANDLERIEDIIKGILDGWWQGAGNTD